MIIKKLAISALLAAATLPMAAAPAKITAAIDSTVIEMGSRAVITLSVVDHDKKGDYVDLPKVNQDFGAYDIVSVTTDTMPAGYKTDITIQGFIPGALTILPFRYAVGGDTVESDVVTLKILPVELDSITTINPMESIANPPSRWYDYIPDWVVWALLGLLFVALAVAAVLLWLHYRKTGKIFMYTPKPIDPYAAAMSALNSLKQRNLIEVGKEKEYYTTLVDILRIYLLRRFSIKAMEMSSAQILHELRTNPETRDNQQRIQQILETADFVKFAKLRPMPDDNVKAFNNVVYFVESTKPAPVEPETKSSGKSGSTSKESKK